MKKFILGIALLLSGVIGFVGTLIACAANEIDGVFDSIIRCAEYNGGIGLLVLFALMATGGLGLCVYSILTDKRDSKQ